MYTLAGPRLKLVQTKRILNIFVDTFSYLRFRLESMSFDWASSHNSPFIQAGITREANDKTEKRSNYLLNSEGRKHPLGRD